MGEPAVSDPLTNADLVVLTLPGVQRYISESRTTADLVSASTQIAALARVAADSMRQAGAQVVIPASDSGAFGDAAVRAGGRGDRGFGGVPNRIVARVPRAASGGRGAVVAGAAAHDVRETWRRWLLEIFPSSEPTTEGFPDPQWVCVPAGPGGYAEQFRVAQQALAARRRVRSFPPVMEQGKYLCSLSGRWPAELHAPKGARSHEAGERLSAVNWAKRLAVHRPGRPQTPSTFSIASAPYRAEVLRRTREDDVRSALLALHAAGHSLGGGETSVSGLELPPGLPAGVKAAAWWLARSGGAWVAPERWQDSIVREAEREGSAGGDSVDVAAGRRAARALADAVGREPGTHLAVVVQDLDNMGRFLGGMVRPAGGGELCAVEPSSHAAVSARLAEAAVAQVALATKPQADPLHGVPVYAGGDDLLMLAPAATAMRLAQAVQDAVPADLPTASTAVFFFSQQASLQSAIRRAHELLEAAKTREGKYGLAVGYERRSGGTYQTVQPWRTPAGTGPAEVFAALSKAGAGGARLSPGLVFDLQRDSDALAGLVDRHQGLLRAEVRRLVIRHSAAAEQIDDAESGWDGATVREFADLLVDLGRREASAAGIQGGFDPVPAARVGVFLRQEAR